MLQNHLTEIKGQLLEMMFTTYQDMNFDEARIDYASFYEEIMPTINSIKNISSIGNLEEFCESYGLNDMDSDMSFPNLVKKYYSEFRQ